MTNYRLLSDESVAAFAKFCKASGINARYPSPQGAFDSKPLARDQDVPVDDLVKLVGGLLAENAALKQRMASDAAPLPPNADDIIDALTELHGMASLDMPSDRFEQTRALVAKITERVHQLQKELNQRINAASLADGGDQPPDFTGKPQRGGAPAMDEMIPSARRIGHDGALRNDGSLERLHANMARIGHA